MVTANRSKPPSGELKAVLSSGELKAVLWAIVAVECNEEVWSFSEEDDFAQILDRMQGAIGGMTNEAWREGREQPMAEWLPNPSSVPRCHLQLAILQIKGCKMPSICQASAKHLLSIC